MHYITQYLCFLLALLGQSFIGFCNSIGKMALFIKEVACKIPLLCRLKDIAYSIWEIGFYSLPVVGFTAVFTGAVLALQTYTGFSRFNIENSVASVVVLSITRELGPVLVGLMLSGRVTAAIAAEFGTMRVTEQIDALKTLNVDPIRYLVLPRFFAGIIVLPILVIVADIIGIMGGYLVSVNSLGFSSASYIHSTFLHLQLFDVISGLIKAIVFGMIITLIGCYYGYYSKGGAQGVGSATTTAVVTSSILILLANYIITGLCFTK